MSSSVELPPIHTEASKREDIEKKNGDGDNDDDDGNDLEKTTRKKSKTVIDWSLSWCKGRGGGRGRKFMKI